MKKRINLIIHFFLPGLFFSCTQIQKIISPEKFQYSKPYKLHENAQEDMVDHLESLALRYVESPNVKIVLLSKEQEDYFKKIYMRIIKNNELLLDSKIEPKVYVIKDKTPFYFSLPGGHFFFSVGLINKYFKHEDLLVSVFAYEIIKSHRNLYPEKVIVPIGYLRTERVMALTRIPIEVKMEIHKWTFYAMRRAGYDPYTILMWLQTQNKNTLDFTLLLGESRIISREEYLFKSFMVKEGLGGKDIESTSLNSSKEFYRLLNFIKSIPT